MAIKIKLFGQLKQITGVSELMVDAMDTDGLMKEMNTRYPVTEKLNYLIAVDRSVIQTNTSIREGQELALLPPYSGG